MLTSKPSSGTGCVRRAGVAVLASMFGGVPDALKQYEGSCYSYRAVGVHGHESREGAHASNLRQAVQAAQKMWP